MSNITELIKSGRGSNLPANKSKERTVVSIDAITSNDPAELFARPKKLRVAAYARVSTEQEEQQNSYATQINYYQDYINKHDNWEFAGIYADEGITGTNTKKRDGFNRMIKDALDGKIDLILTKSVSRFARNTVDVLTYVRELKNVGVEVWFERENLHTLDSLGETLLTMMSSLAQEESHSISENIYWSKRRRMQMGQIDLGYSHFLGYQKGPDGRPEIVEEEAKIIRDIFNWFLEGYMLSEIKAKLEERQIKTPTGKDVWSVSTIQSILKNEKYKGDALLQKTYTVDYLSKKVRPNRGEKESFYITNSHDAIIEPDLFDLAQYELKRRSRLRRKIKKSHPFMTRIRCGHCNEFYGRKKYHNRNGVYYNAWVCNGKSVKRKPCSSPSLKQTEIEEAFTKAILTAIHNKTANTIDEKKNQKTRAKLDEAFEAAEKALDTANKKLKAITEDFREGAKNESDLKHYEAVVKEREELLDTYNEAYEAIILETDRKVKQKRFVDAIKELSIDNILYSDALFIRTVEMITVTKTSSGRNLHFRFLNGVEVDQII